MNVPNASRRERVRCCGSADDLVRLEEEGRGNGEAQGLGGLEVDDQLERGGLFHQEPLGRKQVDHVYDRDGCPLMSGQFRAPFPDQCDMVSGSH
jgi:hypothetical protein